MATDVSDQLVVLRGGLSVPVAPYELILELERRGLRVRRDGNDLLVGPEAALTDEDAAQITRWKAELLALVDYEAPAIQ